jgi:glycosyltransferase involved in cell wall biosynthesis
LEIDESVRFVGKIPHDLMPQFLSVGDIGFACFPDSEYLHYVSNIKVFEYMAAGIPAIVSPTGDLPYYVDYGHAGIISQSDENCLSGELISLLRDNKKRKRLGAYSKQYVTNFDWQVLTQKLIEVYNSTLA